MVSPRAGFPASLEQTRAVPSLIWAPGRGERGEPKFCDAPTSSSRGLTRGTRAGPRDGVLEHLPLTGPGTWDPEGQP